MRVVQTGDKRMYQELRPDLMEHHDYEAINQEMWRYLSSWYGHDTAVCRFLQYDPRTEKTFLDLYPNLFWKMYND